MEEPKRTAEEWKKREYLIRKQYEEKLAKAEEDLDTIKTEMKVTTKAQKLNYHCTSCFQNSNLEKVL